MPTPPRLLSTRLLRFARNDGRRGEDGLLSTDYCLLIKGVDAMFDSVIAIVVPYIEDRSSGDGYLGLRYTASQGTYTLCGLYSVDGCDRFWDR